MAKAAAFLVGLAIVALALATWRVPPGDGVLGADVMLYAVQREGLDLSRGGPIAQARGLTDGGTVEGEVVVRNPGATTVRVRLRAPADRSGLDRMLEVEARAGDVVIYRGRLRGLRRWTRKTFRLHAGESETVELRARLRGAAPGRFATLNLEFRRAA
jgi:hypothetical protein